MRSIISLTFPLKRIDVPAAIAAGCIALCTVTLLPAAPFSARLRTDAARYPQGTGAVILRLDTAEAVFEHNPQMIRAEKLCPGSIAKVWSAAVVLESGNDMPYRCAGTFPVPDSVCSMHPVR